MKSLPAAFIGSLLAVIVAGCGGDSHPTPLASPSIISQPASQTVYSGGTASFAIAASGNPAPSIGWQRSDDNGATWNTISGATSITYNFTVGPADTGAQFRALAANSQGNILSAAATLTEVPAVYAGGRIDVVNPEAGYWLNGTWVPLSSPPDTTLQVNALAVSGNKVIAAGNWLSAGLQIPTGYWLDGNWIDLALPSGFTWGEVNSLVVSGNDLYLAGTLVPGNLPGYWLNGSWNGLPTPPGTDFAFVLSLAVSGGNVYAAGSIYTAGGTSAAPGYWLNGTWTGLPLPAGSSNGIVFSIVVSGSDVYAAGFAAQQAGGYVGNPGYWLNGSWVGLTLPSGQTAGVVRSLVISGTDVYAAGYCENANTTIPGYWLNGAWVGLTVPFEFDGGQIYSLVVSGGKVYAAGLSSTGNLSSYVPGYWVDGVWVALPNPKGFEFNGFTYNSGFSFVTSVVVVP